MKVWTSKRFLRECLPWSIARLALLLLAGGAAVRLSAEQLPSTQYWESDRLVEGKQQIADGGGEEKTGVDAALKRLRKEADRWSK